MPEVDPVILQLRAESEGYQRGVKAAEALSTQKFGQIERSVDKMSDRVTRGFNAAKIAMLAAAGITVLRGLSRLIQGSLEYAGNLGEIAAQAGVTTTALQEYFYAGSQVNLSQADVVQGLEQLNRRMGDAAEGTGTTKDALAKLNVSLRNSKGEIKNAAEIIPEIAEAMKGVSSEAEKGAIRQELFGRSGQKMAALLSGGAAGVNQLRDAAHRLGIVLSEKQIADADKTADKLAELKMVLSTRISGVVADNARSIYQLADALATATSEAVKFINQNPRLIAALAGAAVGSRAGLPGATLGGLGGLGVGNRIARAQADANQDFAFRMTELKRAEDALQKMRGAGGFLRLGFRQKAVIAAQEREVEKLRGLLAEVSARPVGTGAPSALAGDGFGGDLSSEKGGKAEKAAKELADETAAIRARFNAEVRNIMGRYASALAAMATSAEERAEYEMRAVELSRLASLAQIEADDAMSKAQKDELSARIESLAEVERELVDFQKRRQIEGESRDLAEERFRAEQDQLNLQYDLANTDQERRKIALQIVDAQNEYLDSLLQAVIDSKTAGDAEKERARLAQDALRATAGMRRSAADRANETQTERYIREINDINKAVDEIRVDGLRALNDEIVDAIMGAKSLGEAFKNVANQIIADLLRIAVQQAITLPLANALFGGVGGGGLFGGLLGGIIGKRASGGPVTAGMPYLVGERGPELLVPKRNAVVVPNHALTSAAGNTTVVNQTFVLDARHGITTPELLQYVNRTAEKAGRGAYQAAVSDLPVMQAKQRRFGS